MRKAIVALAPGVGLAGCAARPAVISDIGDDRVKVVQYLTTAQESVLDEARRGCGMYGRTPAMISYRCLDEYCFAKEHLFACRP